MRVKKPWTHKKKFGNRKFIGHYRYFRKERLFELTSGQRTITFESHQMAHQLGWRQR